MIVFIIIVLTFYRRTREEEDSEPPDWNFLTVRETDSSKVTGLVNHSYEEEPSFNGELTSDQSIQHHTSLPDYVIMDTTPTNLINSTAGPEEPQVGCSFCTLFNILC